MATDNRVLPLAQLRVYFPGTGDPLVSDRGYRAYDPILHTCAMGTAITYQGGLPAVEVIPDVGLCCRPYLIATDTATASYTKAGAGTWEERIPGTAPLRAKRLCQINAAADTVWSATSTYTAPADASFAVAFQRWETPGDHNVDTYPPFARFEFGGTWGLQWGDGSGLSLMQYVSGTWFPVMDIPEEPERTGEVHVCVRLQRGKLCIKTRQDPEWHVYADPTGADISIAAAAVVFRGQGMACHWGMHQVKYYAATYQGPAWRMQSSHGGAVTLTTRDATLLTSTVVASDVSSGTTAQYRVTLTPDTAGSVPFVWYFSPECYGVSLRFASVMMRPPAVAVNWGEGSLLSIDIDKPFELDQATATVRALRDQSTAPAGFTRWPKAEIWLAELLDGGVCVPALAFTGYLRSVSTDVQSYNDGRATLTFGNVTVKAKRTKINERRGSMPVGGMSVNAALDYFLDYIGEDTASRSWHSWGDTIILPEGTPEDPWLWGKPGDNVWDLMQTVASYAGMEIGANDAGIWYTERIGFTTATTHWLDTVPVEFRDAILGIDMAQDYSEAYTEVVARGTDPWGAPAWANIVDTTAETNVSSDRYSSWPDTYDEDVGEYIPVGMLAIRAQQLAQEYLVVKQEPELSLPARLTMGRRDVALLDGGLLGTTLLMRYKVMSLRHTWDADPSFEGCKTTAQVRRIW